MRAKVNQFAKAHPRFDELADLIEQIVRVKGLDLDTSYTIAAWLRPSRREAIKRALRRHA